MKFSPEYEMAHASVTRQLQETIASNWLCVLGLLSYTEKLAGQDILVGDAGALLKAIERGKITQEQVIQLAMEAENLGLIPSSRIQLIRTRTTRP